MTFFGSSNTFSDVAGLAGRHDAVLVILLRVNHVAHAISSYRHFNKPMIHKLQRDGRVSLQASKISIEQVPWGAAELARAVEEARQSYARLLQFPSRTSRPSHLIFYEDLKRHPGAVWLALQRFLGAEPMVMDGLVMLEARSSNRSAIGYLKDLPALQAELGGEEWADMLFNAEYDDAVNVSMAFEEACRLYHEANISWRLHTCTGGVAHS